MWEIPTRAVNKGSGYTGCYLEPYGSIRSNEQLKGSAFRLAVSTV